MAEENRKGEGHLSAAAKALGKHGGDARAASLSSDRKSAIARQGAEAKNKGVAHQRGRTGKPHARKKK